MLATVVTWLSLSWARPFRHLNNARLFAPHTFMYEPTPRIRYTAANIDHDFILLGTLLRNSGASCKVVRQCLRILFSLVYVNQAHAGKRAPQHCQMSCSFSHREAEMENPAARRRETLRVQPHLLHFCCRMSNECKLAHSREQMRRNWVPAQEYPPEILQQALFVLLLFFSPRKRSSVPACCGSVLFSPLLSYIGLTRSLQGFLPCLSPRVQRAHTAIMAMRLAMRGVAARPVLTPQPSARPVLSWAARWKGSAAPGKGDGAADKKGDAAAGTAAAKAEPAAAEKPKPSPAELPVTFEVGGMLDAREKAGGACVA